MPGLAPVLLQLVICDQRPVLSPSPHDHPRNLSAMTIEGGVMRTAFTATLQLGLVAHAAKGQTVDQQKVDAKECYDVAKSQTGFDPLTAPPVDPAAAAAA